MKHLADYIPPPVPGWDQKMWDHDLPRLTRFADQKGLPPGLVVRVDRASNLATINMEMFIRLDKAEQTRVLRAHHDIEVV